VSARAAAFWGSALGAGWVVVGYPALLALLPRRDWATGDGEPRVSILIPAFREHDALRAKLTALYDLDYPREKLEVIVAVDEDRELADMASATYPEAEVLFSEERGGKAAGMNRALARATGDVVLMTDANNVLEPGSVRAAARHFADRSVWAVAGRRGEAGSAYDAYEDLLRRLETRSGSVAAMSGEFMAVRREHVSSLPADVVNDDLWLLCQLVRGGGRVLYEPQAASSEPGLENPADELARRSRIGAGRAMLLRELQGLPPGFAARLVSHKFGRLALPFLLLGALGSSLTLVQRPAYRGFAGLQLAVYALGGLSAAGIEPPPPGRRVARAARQLVLGNVATAVGVVRGLRGRQSVRWQAVR
jgi:glycosyltransferase involved in cell wall biosynthesis